MKAKQFFNTLAASMMLAAMTVCFTACSNNNDDNPVTPTSDIPEAAKDVVGLEKFKTKIDYSQTAHWAALPQEATKAVDVFYIYPTVTTSKGGTVVISDIDSPEMLVTVPLMLRIQASVFAESCNIFAPYYRQISLPTSNIDYQPVIDYIAQFDATDALDYYLNHLNKGRPFILAGHSQGSSTLVSLLGNYMKQHPEAMQRMVAAYVIGFSVTKEWLKRTGLKFAEGATDTGVIISWNTEGPGNKNATNLVVRPGAVSINPINWKRDATYAPASNNLGSFDNATGQVTVPGVADAQLDLERGVVVVTSVNPADYAITDATALFGPECYHGQDYAFFYNNIRQNVADRIAAWGAK